MTKDKIIDRLQKLQAKADSAREIGNEAEAIAFAEKVQELLMKHKLDMSVLSIKRQDEDEPLGAAWVDTRGKQKQAAWVVTLATEVAVAYFCRILIVPGSDTIIIVGRKTDRQIAEYVLLRLINFIDAEARKQHSALRYRLWKENDGDMSGAHGFQASFRKAAVLRICRRLRELRKKEVAKGGSVALVIRKSDEEVERLVEEISDGRTKNIQMKDGHNEDGYRAGLDAGDRADISGSGLGSGRDRGSLPSAT